MKRRGNLIFLLLDAFRGSVLVDAEPRAPTGAFATTRADAGQPGLCAHRLHAFYALRYPDLGAPPRERRFYLVQSRAVEIRPRSL